MKGNTNSNVASGKKLYLHTIWIGSTVTTDYIKVNIITDNNTPLNTAAKIGAWLYNHGYTANTNIKMATGYFKTSSGGSLAMGLYSSGGTAYTVQLQGVTYSSSIMPFHSEKITEI